MIKIGYHVRIDTKRGEGYGRTKDSYKATIVACSNYCLVVKKENGIRESYNIGQLLDNITTINVKHGKEYDPVSKEEIKKMFGVR